MCVLGSRTLNEYDDDDDSLFTLSKRAQNTQKTAKARTLCIYFERLCGLHMFLTSANVLIHISFNCFCGFDSANSVLPFDLDLWIY